MLLLGLLLAALGGVLAYAADCFKVEGEPLVEKIDALLPQIQCAKCGFPGCKPYAQAIARGEAEINRCPPGGEATFRQLADLLGYEANTLNSKLTDSNINHRARIIEADCIGCTQCIPVCPVDAILGASKFMHTVIASECTGCGLCLPPCPMDCIVMIPISESPSSWHYPVPKIDD
jgi:electron transport complex protein RnfB